MVIIMLSGVVVIGLSTILMTRLSAILMVLGGSGPVHKRLVQTGPRTTQDWLGLVLSGPGPGPTTFWMVYGAVHLNTTTCV